VAATAAGVVAHTAICLVSDHPVCGAKVGFAEIFLMPQHPSSRGGDCGYSKQPADLINEIYDQGRLNPIVLDNPMVFLSEILTVPRTVPP
jgi:hypothetical protein